MKGRLSDLRVRPLAKITGPYVTALVMSSPHTTTAQSEHLCPVVLGERIWILQFSVAVVVPPFTKPLRVPTKLV